MQMGNSLAMNWKLFFNRCTPGMDVHKSIRHSCSFISYCLSPFSWKLTIRKTVHFICPNSPQHGDWTESRGSRVGEKVGGIKVGTSAGRKLHVPVRDRPRGSRRPPARGTALCPPQPPGLPRSPAAEGARAGRGRSPLRAAQHGGSGGGSPGPGAQPRRRPPHPGAGALPGTHGARRLSPGTLDLPPSRSARRAPHGSRAGRREPEPVSLPPSPQAGQELPGGGSAAPGAGTGTHRVRGAVGSRGRRRVSGAVPGNRERERRSAGGAAGGREQSGPGPARPALRPAPARLRPRSPAPAAAAPPAAAPPRAVCQAPESLPGLPAAPSLPCCPCPPLPWRWPRVGAPEPSGGAPPEAPAPLRARCRAEGGAAAAAALLWCLGFGRCWSAGHPDSGKPRGLRWRSSEWAPARLQGWAVLRCPQPLLRFWLNILQWLRSHGRTP